MEFFLGVDPGISGGLAVIDSKGSLLESQELRKLTDHDLNDWMYAYEYSFCVLENVHSVSGDGSKGAFTFGMNFGFLKGILVASGIPFELISPQKWQKEFSLIQHKKTLTKTEKKNLNKQKAQYLFPNTKITHATADAILIAEYCRRVRR